MLLSNHLHKQIFEMKAFIPISLLILLYYFLLTTDAHLNPFQTVPIGLTFNSMLEHLLRGEFNVSEDAVKYEGYLRDGKIYSYWGIFCALLRIPLALFPNGLTIDVTMASCTIAAWIGSIVKLRALSLFKNTCPPTLLLLTACVIVFGSNGVGFLRAIVYQEVILWSNAIASLYIYIFMRGIVFGKFNRVLLSGMAVCAALGLSTRVTFGIGMYTGLFILLLTLAFLRKLVLIRSTVLPIMILIAGVGIAGFVNHQRWGNPAIFYDTSGYAMNSTYPDRRVREDAYGKFNVVRIPYSIDYYFGSSWTLVSDTGYIWERAHFQLFDILEMPPSSFFLTDAYLIALYYVSTKIGTYRSRQSQRVAFLSVGAGFCAQAGLILCAIATAYRYRQEFYPLFDTLLFACLCRFRPDVHISARNRRLLLTFAWVSIFTAHGELVLYKTAPLGPYFLNAPKSMLEYYRQRFLR